MSHLQVVEKIDELEFCWGKKRGIGGPNRDVRFYESFSYDNVEYRLYDSVYMYNENAPKPYVGILVKAWETSKKFKKVKIHWFFRPSEISYYLRDENVVENELFLASGDGRGLANINPLEAIAGKCHTVCISKDARNWQPTKEDIQNADYVFYRVFDISHCTISDKIEHKVGGLEVKYVFNRSEFLDSVKRTYLVHSSKPHHNNGKVVETANHVIERRETHPRPFRLNYDKLLGESSSEVGDREISSRKTDLSESMPAKRLKVFFGSSSSNKNEIGSCATFERKKRLRKLDVSNHDVGRHPQRNQDRVGLREHVREDDTSSLSKKLVGALKEKPSFVLVGDEINFHKNDEMTKDSKVHGGKLPNEMPSSSKKEPEFNLEDQGCEKSRLENGSSREKVSETNGFVSSEGTTLLGPHALVGERPLNFGKSLSISNSKPMESSTLKANGKLGACHQPKDVGKLRDLSLSKGESQKNAKPDDYAKRVLDDNKSGVRKIESPRNDYESKMDKASTFKGKEDKKPEVKIFTISKKPIHEKANWIKLSWEDRLKAAQDDGKLILLQNLDPKYTSGEIEDIIWHAFEEDCNAKVVQHVPTFNPHYGQAFAIFKSRGAVYKILRRLDERCLMLPNQRPLIARVGDISKYLDNKKLFFGHLAFDKLRRQTQMRDSVSTSHYTQPNTVEFEMAMAWLVLQLKFDESLKVLYEKQDEKLEKVRATLKVE